MQEAKLAFKNAETLIRKKSLSSSRRSLIGKFIERFVPFLANISYSPADMHFLGQPVDYVVFEGLRDDKVKAITFLEVKTGNSQLTAREKSIKKAVESHKVYWDQVTVPTQIEKNGEEDETAEEGDSSIEEFYQSIDSKIGEVSKNLFKEYEVTCKKCKENVIVEVDSSELKELSEGETIGFDCVECGKSFEISLEDIKKKGIDKPVIETAGRDSLILICAECMTEYPANEEGVCPKCGSEEAAVKEYEKL